MIHKFTYFEHIGFADIASQYYYLIDGEEYVIFRENLDSYTMYRGSYYIEERTSYYIEGKFFRRYNSDLVEMRIMLHETKELPVIMEKTEIKWIGL